MDEQIQIVEAAVNGVPEWRVYIDYVKRYVFPTKEQAEQYVMLHNRDKKK